jgi:hypothetical protein
VDALRDTQSSLNYKISFLCFGFVLALLHLNIWNRLGVDQTAGLLYVTNRLTEARANSVQIKMKATAVIAVSALAPVIAAAVLPRSPPDGAFQN